MHLRRYVAADEHGRRRLRREWFFRFARTFTPVIAVDWPAGRFFVSTHDRDVGMPTFVDGPFDEGSIDRLLRLVERVSLPADGERRGTVIEVGANIGTTSVMLARGFPAMDIVAVEPAPANLDLLRATIATNGLERRVVVIPAAVGTHAGMASLELSERNSGDHRVRVADVGGEADEFNEGTREVIEVRLVTLDDIVADVVGADEDVAFLWIDAQGFEGHVLAGASDTLAKGVPAVAEYWPYGLHRTGGLDMFEQHAIRHYRSFVDVSRVTDEASVLNDVRPIAELPEPRGRYTAPRDFTDLILLPDDTA